MCRNLHRAAQWCCCDQRRRHAFTEGLGTCCVQGHVEGAQCAAACVRQPRAGGEGQAALCLHAGAGPCCRQCLCQHLGCCLRQGTSPFSLFLSDVMCCGRVLTPAKALYLSSDCLAVPLFNVLEVACECCPVQRCINLFISLVQLMLTDVVEVASQCWPVARHTAP